jgi:hypothetical protein
MLEPFYDFLRNTREFGLAYTTSRFYSAYMGKVKEKDDLLDEQGQQRVRVCVEAVTHRDEALSQWAYPVTPYAGKDKGFIFPPDEGDAVWVTFDEGRPDQPRYLGSWWCNDDADADPKSPDKSFMPKEFRPKTKDDPPTARGFKTKLGHGFLMEDNTDSDKGHRIEMWTGEQEEEGEEATQHHRLEFNDQDQFIQINSYGKEGDSEDERWQHSVRMDDKEEFVIVRSAGQSKDDYHYLEMQDKDGYIRIQTAEKKRFLVFEEQDLIIQIKTEGDFTTKWDEKNKKITTSTKDREFTLNDNDSEILLKGPKQTFKMGDSSGTELTDTSGQAVAITSDGDVTVTAQSNFTVEATGNADITATGSSTHDITGSMEIKAASMKETLQGSFEQTCATFKSTAQSIHEFVGQIFKFQGSQFQVQVGIPSGIQLGSGGKQLVNLEGMITYNTHTHLVVGALPGQALATFSTMIPFVHTTQTTVAA